MKKEINTNQAPKAIGAYSQAVLFGNMLFVSGQIPLDVSTAIIPDNIRDQTKQCLDNIKYIIEEAGFTMENIVKCGIFTRNMSDFIIINEAYQAYFKNPYPARFIVEVSRLPKDVLIEIDAIALASDKE